MAKSLAVDYGKSLSKIKSSLQEIRDAPGEPSTTAMARLTFHVAELMAKAVTYTLLPPFSLAALTTFIDSLSKPGRITDNHVENIKEYIKVGKENGLKELEIRVSDEFELSPGADLTPVGIPVKVNVKYKSGGSTVIKATY